METKYTTDGKKVVIIGNLNSQEKIVQEVFVTANGAELPSGENFVVTSLHDEPVKSWKSYEQDKYAKLEIQAKAQYEALQQEIKSKQGKLKDASLLLSDRIKWTAGALKEVSLETFDFLVKFCAGELTHVVVNDYGDWNVLTIEQLVTYNENDRWSDITYKNLRLISLYGYSEGKLDYRVNGYGDGSGSDKGVKFFESYDKAVEYLSGKLLEVEKYNHWHLKAADKYGIQLDIEKLKDYDDAQMALLQKNIDEQSAKLSEYKDSLKNYKRGVSSDKNKSRSK